MTLPQLIDAATSPLAILIATVILAFVVQPWLGAHRAQVDALTASIKDSHLRMAAETVVRWLETDPAQAQLPGLIQRANGITLLAQRTGLPETTVAVALDASYNYLKGSGQLVVAPKAAPAATIVDTDVADRLGRIEKLLTSPISIATTPDLSAPIQDAPPVMGVGKIYLPPGLPAQPQTPLSNGTAGDTAAEPVTTGG